MKRREWRRAAAVLAIPVLMAVSPGPAIATFTASGFGAESLGSVVRSAHSAQPAKAAPPACIDRAYSLLGGKWKTSLQWRYQSSSTPGGLSASTVLTVIKRSFDNITGVRNDCGLVDNVSASATYLGTTTAAPGVTKRGNCAPSDGNNVVGFGQLPSGVLAVTCVRSNGHGSMVEADIRINSSTSWALTESACAFWQQLLEPTLTHEVGHAFGLGHVGEQKHGRLTMSPISDGPCSNAETTLGRGDVRGLRHLYPL